MPTNRNASRALSDRSIVSDLVSDAPDSGNRTVVAELAPQLAHVHVHRAGVPRKRVAPHPLQQLVPGQYESAVVEQLPEQVELLGRQLHLLAADGDLAAAGVDAHVAVLEHRLLRLAGGLRGAAKDGLDAGHQLARVEWLG